MTIDIDQEMANMMAGRRAALPNEAPAAPRPKRGAQRTRLNAYKHGLTGEIHIVTPEEQSAFDVHCKSICEALAPVGALEIELAQDIAEDKWRLKRARAIESGIFASGKQGLLGFSAMQVAEDPAQLQIDDSLIQARTWLAENDNFMLLALYGQRIQRSIERNMAELRTLRAERKAALDQAIEDARVLAQHAQSKGETYDPARDFPPELQLIYPTSADSVFSAAAITRLIARAQSLNDARDYAKARVNPKSGRQMPAVA